VNDIMHTTSLELARFQEQELIKRAERARLIREAREDGPSNFSRFVRRPVGRAMVAAGRKVQGCTATPQFEETDTSPAFTLVR
jgi:hypothetical protein